MGTVEYEFERQDQYFKTSKFSFGYYIQPAIMATTKNMVTFLAIAFQLMVFSNALPQGLLGKLFNRRVGSDPCTRGPAHWCASIENIFECGIGAYQHCKREREQQNTPALLGQDRCTFGPSYWCQSIDTIFECGNGAYEHCKKDRNTAPVTISPPVVGADPCTRGPSHWCQSVETALQCGSGAFDHCTRQNQQQNSAPLPGSDPCTFGPSHICKDFQLATRCGATFDLCNRFIGSAAPGSSFGSTAPVPLGQEKI